MRKQKYNKIAMEGIIFFIFVIRLVPLKKDAQNS
jgi:hypothetical protein